MEGISQATLMRLAASTGTNSSATDADEDRAKGDDLPFAETILLVKTFAELEGRLPSGLGRAQAALLKPNRAMVRTATTVIAPTSGRPGARLRNGGMGDEPVTETSILPGPVKSLRPPSRRNIVRLSWLRFEDGRRQLRGH